MLVSTLVMRQEQEKKIKRSDLPAAVQKAVVAQSEAATVRGFSKENENRKTFYEVELMVQGHSKDVLMDPNGAVVEVEGQVPIESLSPAVRDVLQARAGNGKLSRLRV
jgi:hypothetical protein